MLQSDAIHDLAEANDDSFVNFVYFFQTALLLCLVTAGGWTLAAAGVIDSLAPWWPPIIGWFLILITLMAVRDCWHVVNLANAMLLHHRLVRDRERRK